MSRTWSARGGVRTRSHTMSNNTRADGVLGKGGGEREIIVVVTQCLLLPTRTHHSYTTHTVSLRGGE